MTRVFMILLASILATDAGASAQKETVVRWNRGQVVIDGPGPSRALSEHHSAMAKLLVEMAAQDRMAFDRIVPRSDALARRLAIAGDTDALMLIVSAHRMPLLVASTVSDPRYTLTASAWGWTSPDGRIRHRGSAALTLRAANNVALQTIGMSPQILIIPGGAGLPVCNGQLDITTLPGQTASSSCNYRNDDADDCDVRLEMFVIGRLRTFFDDGVTIETLINGAGSSQVHCACDLDEDGI